MKPENSVTYEIGTKVWHKGDKVTITSEPFILHGGEFQNAVTEGGKAIVVATPSQKAANASRAIEEREAQQAEFRRLTDTNGIPTCGSCGVEIHTTHYGEEKCESCKR